MDIACMYGYTITRGHDLQHTIKTILIDYSDTSIIAGSPCINCSFQ